MGANKGGLSNCEFLTTTNAKINILSVNSTVLSLEDVPGQRKRVLTDLPNCGFYGDFEYYVAFE